MSSIHQRPDLSLVFRIYKAKSILSFVKAEEDRNTRSPVLKVSCTPSHRLIDTFHITQGTPRRRTGEMFLPPKRGTLACITCIDLENCEKRLFLSQGQLFENNFITVRLMVTLPDFTLASWHITTAPHIHSIAESSPVETYPISTFSSQQKLQPTCPPVVDDS